MRAIAQKATEAWGEPPDWIVVLADECDKSSQSKVAKALGASSTVVSRILANAYPGDVGKIEALVRGHFMAATVECPVLTEISRQRCIAEQAKPLTFQNPIRRRVYDACRDGCPHSRIADTSPKRKGTGS